MGLTETVSTVDIKERLTGTISKKLTAWSRVLLEKLTVPQLFKFGSPEYYMLYSTDSKACHK
jgi:hypothetical protein